MVTPLTPETRAKHPQIRGNPVRLGGQDGHDWLLLDYPPVPGGVWDSLHDAWTLRRRYPTVDVQRAAVRLLDANYDLTPDESVGLILNTDPALFVAAVEHAIFGPPDPYRSHSHWVRSALLANGLIPDRIAPDDLGGVLCHLVGTGRILPENHFTTMGIWLRKQQQRHAQINAY